MSTQVQLSRQISVTRINSLASVLYAIGIIGIAGQQFYYKEFRPVIIPYWPTWLPGQPAFAYLIAACMILLSAGIILGYKGRNNALLLGGLLLILTLIFHLPSLFFVTKDVWHLGLWTNALKELALSGGAFVVAGSLPNEKGSLKGSRTLQGFVSAGRIFLAIMLICFGIDHFLYSQFVATLVPVWAGMPLFWTYFAGIALIGTGVSIILNIKRKQVSLLAGFMLFIWFLVLHIPRAIQYPDLDKGNELTSVFEALAFSGVAFLIAFAKGD
ncbi:MAG: hypothetical protein C5B59_15690 [Bacteroidetes bacterium]|nr:MAG: hypothetical protein C5B59_15690 [Bacteroidota bacterium]